MSKPQLMGNLTKERIAVFRPPFTITGFDCFGPVTIKQYKQTRTSNNRQRDMEFCLLASHQGLDI